MGAHLQEQFLEGQIILLDKPLGWTSFDLVKKVRYLIKKELGIKKIKVGHAGTLDPLATGLLVICTGKATKNIANIQLQDKEYSGVMTLGATTASFDLETKIEKEFPTNHITQELIQECARSFIGEQEQIAPMHSAKKIDGKRAYEYAREGKTKPIKSNHIQIKEFEVTPCSIPKFEAIDSWRNNIKREKVYEKGMHLRFRIVCSKGTYIRSVVRDFASAMNTGGHLTSLRRTRIGNYHLGGSVGFDEIIK